MLVHLFEVFVEHIEQKEQQFLCILLGIVVELWQQGAQHRSGLHRATTGASPQPHLLQ